MLERPSGWVTWISSFSTVSPGRERAIDRPVTGLVRRAVGVDAAQADLAGVRRPDRRRMPRNAQRHAARHEQLARPGVDEEHGTRQLAEDGAEACMLGLEVGDQRLACLGSGGRARAPARRGPRSSGRRHARPRSSDAARCTRSPRRRRSGPRGRGASTPCRAIPSAPRSHAWRHARASAMSSTHSSSPGPDRAAHRPVLVDGQAAARGPDRARVARPSRRPRPRCRPSERTYR